MAAGSHAYNILTINVKPAHDILHALLMPHSRDNVPNI